MKCIDYRTKTIFKEADNGYTGNGYFWESALDIGYSGVKLYGPNLCAVFPSYAKEINRSAYIGELTTDDILYTDLENGKTWLVGRAAQNMIQFGDTNDSIEALCGRNRYFTPMFLVIARTGLALTMMQTRNAKYKYEPSMLPVIQTGLPCRYMGDEPYIKEALTGRHHFSIQLGNGYKHEFDFVVSPNYIKVMQQPMGAFISASTDALWIQDIRKFQKQNVLIADPGFNTLDTFSVLGGAISSEESWTDYSMKRILQETSDTIYEKYHQEIPVACMQKTLENGTFTYINRKERKTSSIEFADILDAASHKVFNEALDKLYDMYDSFADYRFIILTGGTGAAWAPWFTDALKNMETLSVISGYTPDGNPQYFANVRGYYQYLKQYVSRLPIPA